MLLFGSCRLEVGGALHVELQLTTGVCGMFAQAIRFFGNKSVGLNVKRIGGDGQAIATCCQAILLRQALRFVIARYGFTAPVATCSKQTLTQIEI